MKFPWFWRWRKHPDDDTPVQPTPTQALPATASTVDLTLTRRMFYRAVNPSQDTPCPRCGKTLSPETGVYVIATRQGGQPGDHFMISGDFGFYCASCPTVVIDPEQVVDVLQIGATGWDVGDAYSVLQLVASIL